MADQETKAKAFHRLHVAGEPLLLYNIWDAGSAKAVAAAGAAALATGSASVAGAHGYEDGENVPLGLALTNVEEIVRSTKLPVSLDFERGYGAGGEEVGESVAAALNTGIVGCNIEDSREAGHQLRDVHDQAGRIAAARAAADRAGISLFINARTDVFFQKPAEQHDEEMVEEALRRAQAYHEAGANGLFVPLLVDEALIRRVVDGSPLPVNIMAFAGTPPLARLAELGVARVSFGPGPYRLAMRALEEAAREAFQSARQPVQA
jgi:2-methylisocitrate lyase-like PEP mutase family enzyme